MQDSSQPVSHFGDLDESLGFQLKMLQIDTDVLAREALAPFEISPARVAALMIIKANPGCNQTKLGDAFAVNRASAMKMVNFFESRGLVRRAPGADTRANALFLTPDGESALRKMNEALQKADRRALDALSRNEIKVLFNLIQRMRDALRTAAKRLSGKAAVAEID